MGFSRSSALVGAICAFSYGCTSGAPEDAGVESHGASSLALVQLERHTDPVSAQPRLSTFVKVARYRGVDGERLLRLLGAEARDLDSCSLASGLDDAPLASAAHVELLSVGSIGLRVGDQTRLLAPRLFPALATMAAGVFYADAFDSERDDTADYAVSAPGENGTGRFELQLPAPDDVRALSVASSAPSNAVLARSSDVSLAWEPALGADRVEVELYAGGSVLSCVARDDGQFALPRAKLQGLDADDNATLVVRRVRLLPLDVQGIEAAYARVASTRSFAVRVQ